MELERGQVVDRYTVHRELGRGGMAVVYLVQHNTLETLHALKVLTVGSHKIRDRLIQEGKVQAQLRHVNVVAVTDVLDVDGSPGLLMEYVEGPALDTWLLGKRLDVDEAERLFRGILDGVQRAHQLGIVHRDLKPANVMLSEGPDGWIPKVTDFGLAKALQEEGDIQRTRTGMPMGTPSYMSPEQIRDAKGVDQRTDIFALGCILYELTCGQRAFFGRDMLEIFNAVAQGRHTASTTLVPDMPARVDQAINGSLVVDRERRIPDCGTLRAVLAGEKPWQTTPPSVPETTFDFFGDSPAATAAQSEFLAAARDSLASVPPARPPPGGTFSMDELDEEPPLPAQAPPKPQPAPMPSGFAGPSLDPPTPAPDAATQPPPAPSISHERADSIAPAPARPVIPWVIAALAVGAAVTFGGITMLDRGVPASAPPAAEAPSAPDPVPELPAQPVEPPVAEPALPAAEDPPAAPASQPVAAPNPPAGDEAQALAAPASAPPAAPPSPDPAPLVEAAPSTAMVSFEGADSLQLEEVDFRHRFDPGPVPPGRYRILAGFGGASPVPAGEIELSAGQRVRLSCDADFRRCR